MKSNDKSVDTTDVKPSPLLGTTDVALAKADTLEPATEVAASGALIEPTIIERVNTDHPAVDNNPRVNMPVISNRIDFNDPNQSGADAVAEMLGK